MDYTAIILLFATTMAFSAKPANGGSHGQSHSHGSAPSVAPKEAFKLLVEGNERFMSQKSALPKQDQARRKALAQSQQPHTIVLSCSDSSTPPELLFDLGLGEIFSIRVAGNVLGAATVASIEYAVAHLGARLILVMGHESCGAVKTAMATPPERSVGSPDLDTVAAEIRPNIEGVNRKVASDDKTIRGPVKLNVSGVAKRLVTRSSIIRKAVESGKVQVVEGIYGLESGKVDFWNTETLH